MDDLSPTQVADSLVRWLPQMHSDGVLVVCLDYRSAPTMVRRITEAGWCYRGEVIWEFGLGRPRTSWWPVRHNNLLTFTASSNSGTFDAAAAPRVPRAAIKKGYPTDRPIGSVWNITMSNLSPQRVGYPNQKPLEIIEPFVLAHTEEGDLVLDPYCGASSVGIAAINNHRKFLGFDINPEAIAISLQRIQELQQKING